MLHVWCLLRDEIAADLVSVAQQQVDPYWAFKWVIQQIQLINKLFWARG